MRAVLFVVLVVLMGKLSESRASLNVVHFEKTLNMLEKEADKVARLFNIDIPSRKSQKSIKSVETSRQWATTHVKNLGSFSWKNCGKATDPIRLLNLSIKPDPVVLPGTLSIGFAIISNKTVVAPLTGDVLLQKKVGSTYITLPCIGNFGSCHYDDFCQVLSGIPQCPPEFISSGIPCQCPFQQGNYSLPNITFDLDMVPLPSGEYHGKINMAYLGAELGCIEVYLDIDGGSK